jgi:hypothetical protein
LLAIARVLGGGYVPRLRIPRAIHVPSLMKLL